MFRVTVDPSRLLVTMTAAGFFTPEATHQAGADLHVAIRSLGPDVGRHVTLYDLRALHVAPGDAIGEFRHYFTDPKYAPIWARKVAFVTRSALATLQMKRVRAGLAHIQVFTDREAALAWLMAV